METCKWKQKRGIPVPTQRCRLCNSQEENLQHLLSGCTVLAGSEYLTRHNQALMVFAVEWAKHKGLIPENARWYKENWKSGEVYENNEYKMIWDFQFKLKKTEKARRPDLILEDHAEKNIIHCGHGSTDGKKCCEKEKEQTYQVPATGLRNTNKAKRIQRICRSINNWLLWKRSRYGTERTYEILYRQYKLWCTKGNVKNCCNA